MKEKEIYRALLRIVIDDITARFEEYVTDNDIRIMRKVIDDFDMAVRMEEYEAERRRKAEEAEAEAMPA